MPLRDTVAHAGDHDTLAACDALRVAEGACRDDARRRQGFAERFAALTRRKQGVFADYKGVAPRKAVRRHRAVGQTRAVGECKGVVPHEVAVLVAVPHGAQHEREKLRFVHGSVWVKFGCTAPADNAVFAGIADIGCRPRGHVVEGNGRRVFQCFALGTEKAHDLDDRFRARQPLLGAKVAAAVVEAFEQPQRVQRIGGVGLTCRRRRKAQCKREQNTEQSYAYFFHINSPRL